MSEAEISEAIRRRYAPSVMKPDYREKLKRAHPDAPSPEPTSTAISSPAERVRALAEERDTEGAAVQSVLVAAVQVLHRVRQRELQVAGACLSKGQDEKFHRMLATLDDTDQALRDTLSEQGRKMLDLTMPPSDTEDETSWWFTLTEALQTIEEDIEWIIALVARQPKGSTGRTFSGVIVRLLRRHYNVLLVEAEQWME